MSYSHHDPNQSVYAKDLFSVKDHVVVITGGGTGLGKHMASGLFKNGAKVYIVGRRKEVLDDACKEIESESEVGGTIVAVQGDVSTKAGALDIVTKLKGLVNHVDVLVNNAAVQKNWRNPIKDPAGHDDPDQVERLMWDGVEDEDFNSTNSININGTYWMTAALVPLLRKSEIKSVIVISSIAATANQRATSSLTYGVSKAGVSHLATMLAGRLSPLKIRVNTICPGTFASELTSTTSPDGSVNMFEGAGKACMRTPLRRAGYKHEILGPVMLLASRAGGYMDNAVLAVDGGRNMVAGINDGVPLPDEAY